MPIHFYKVLADVNYSLLRILERLELLRVDLCFLAADFVFEVDVHDFFLNLAQQQLEVLYFFDGAGLVQVVEEGCGVEGVLIPGWGMLDDLVEPRVGLDESLLPISLHYN